MLQPPSLLRPWKLWPKTLLRTQYNDLSAATIISLPTKVPAGRSPLALCAIMI